MILVDFFCPKCDKRYIDVFIDSKEPLPKCDVCEDVELKKLISKPISFELKYDNRTDICDWDGNSTQYWKEIKEKGGEEPPNSKQYKWS
jgi:hypothetical protein